MKFENAKQLANHVKNFCFSSPYGNMQGLIEVETKDTKYSRVDGNRSHLQDYGKQTIGKMKNLMTDNNNLAQNALRNREKELLDDLMAYNKRKQSIGSNLVESQVKSISSRMGISPASLPKNRQYAKQPNYELNSSAVEQSNAQARVKDMTPEERWKYADNKLRELENIKESYMENGGSDVYFLTHLDNLYNFYNNLKAAKTTSQVRIETPINKLRMSNRSNVERENSDRMRGAPTNIQDGLYKSVNTAYQNGRRQEAIRNTQQQIYPHQVYQQNHQSNPNNPPPYQPYAQPYAPSYAPPPYYPPPQVIVVPQPSRPEPQTNSINYLQRMLNIKDDEIRQLTNIIKERSQPQQPLRHSNPPNSYKSMYKSDQVAKMTAENVYSMKPIEQDMLPEQRILLSMEKQELDEMRLLNMLPQDLQKIKFETMKNMSELRMQVQKQLSQQRLERMRHQFELQGKEEQRMLENELWVDEQRKKAVSQRLLEDNMMM